MPNKLRNLRKEKKLSQEELAKKSGVSRAIISGLESGRTAITTTGTLEKLAKALETSISNFFN